MRTLISPGSTMDFHSKNRPRTNVFSHCWSVSHTALMGHDLQRSLPTLAVLRFCELMSRLGPKVCLQRWGKIVNTTLPPSFLHRDLAFCGSVFPFLHKNWINLSEAAAQQKLKCLPRKSFLCASCTSGVRAEIFPLPAGQRETLQHGVTPFDLSDFSKP